MADQIKETDTLNQGRIKINAAIDLANESSDKVDGYKDTLDKGVTDAKKIASDAGNEAKQIATEAGTQANVKADKAVADSNTAVNTANQALSRANQNKQEFDALENEFQDLVAESGDSNPEIVQARTDTQGIKQTTLQSRLTKDFSERMTTADAVQMFSGPINTPKMMDFSGKTAGNTSSNPHAAYSDYTATSLKKPSASWNEMSQDNYNKLAGRDDSGVSTGSTQNGVIPQQRGYFNILETVKQLAPNIFNGLDTGESVKYIKDNFISFSLSIRAKASSPNNKVLKVAAFLESTDSYSTQIQETALDYEDFKIDINDSNFINSAGELNILIYSDSSNGVTSSLIDVDYFGVQLTISLNPLSVLESSGFAKKEYVDSEVNPLATKEALSTHVDNKQNPHDTNKTHVGLGLVENYGVATQEEAESGSATNKYMTPLRVFQAISKWVQGKFVNKTGDEDVDGVKNFTSVPQINNIPIAIDRGTAYKEITLNSSIHANIKGGFIRLWRTGNIVVVGVSLSLAGPVRWVNLASFPTGFTPQSTGSFGIPLGSTEGDQLPATIYTGSGNFRLLTSGSIPTSYTFQGSGVYYTEEDFPS
jgi:F0F1-type ATP synthase membrane subunit b/b'